MSDLATPTNCTADFCLVPVGTGSASVSEQVADVQRLLQKCGLRYSMHSAGTTVEGPWDRVMTVIGQAHTMLHEKGIVRCHTDIRVGSRIDKSETADSKVQSVQRLLSQDQA